MKKQILTLLIISAISPALHAETMQGGSYTLNGSVDVMMNQGSGGSYTLNPNGDGMGGGNISGGVYVLYPTPYTNPQSSATTEVIRSVSYGAGGGYSSTSGASTNPGNTNANPDTDVPNYSNNPTTPNGTIIPNPSGDGTTGYYNNNGEFIEQEAELGTQYGYPTVKDTVNFGKGTSTQETGNEKNSSSVGKKFLWLIIIILILMFIRRLYKRMQGQL